jgi:CheY-like chemotaxis protein
VKHLRETTCEHEVSHPGHAPNAGGEPDATPKKADGETQPGPQEVAGVVSKKGRVLLLEDDAESRDFIRDWLVEKGYGVVAVENGADGVREVMNGDVTLVLCDVELPGLPGEGFYRAVERVRPDLCPRFIFITGQNGDEKTDEFIQAINGFVLRKPFNAENLRDSIFAAEAVRTFQSVSENVTSDPPPSSGGLSPCLFVRLEDPETTEKVARILARSEKQ